MKRLFNKNIRVSAALLILSIGFYGSVYAQQACCKMNLSVCVSASAGITGNFVNDSLWATFRSYDPNSQQWLKLFQNTLSTGFGSANTCCETDHCNDYNQVAYLNHSSVQGYYPVKKDADAHVTVLSSKTSFEPYHHLSTSFKSSPIYILKQSIAC